MLTRNRHTTGCVDRSSPQISVTRPVCLTDDFVRTLRVTPTSHRHRTPVCEQRRTSVPALHPSCWGDRKLALWQLECLGVVFCGDNYFPFSSSRAQCRVRSGRVYSRTSKRRPRRSQSESAAAIRPAQRGHGVWAVAPLQPSHRPWQRTRGLSAEGPRGWHRASGSGRRPCRSQWVGKEGGDAKELQVYSSIICHFVTYLKMSLCFF